VKTIGHRDEGYQLSTAIERRMKSIRCPLIEFINPIINRLIVSNELIMLYELATTGNAVAAAWRNVVAKASPPSSTNELKHYGETSVE
jgi:hypothetical protein